MDCGVFCSRCAGAAGRGSSAAVVTRQAEHTGNFGGEVGFRQQNEGKIPSQKRELIYVREEAKPVAAFCVCSPSGAGNECFLLHSNSEHHYMNVPTGP